MVSFFFMRYFAVVLEKVDESTKDYDRAKVAKELGMVKDDHRLEKFRDDATVAFRYVYVLLFVNILISMPIPSS
jgi:hypothetical protein